MRIRLFSLVAVAVLVSAAVDAHAGTSGGRAPAPGELWEEFPLEEGGVRQERQRPQTRQVPTTPVRPRPEPAPARPRAEQPAPAEGDSGLALSPRGLVLLALALALAGGSVAALGALGLRKRRAVAVPPGVELRFRAHGRLLPEAILAEARQLARDAGECDNVTSPAREPRSERVLGHPEEMSVSRASGTASGRAYADIGDRVASVLRAAEEAAEQIKADAHQEAAELRREAEERASARTREAAEESEHVRAAAERYAADTRGAVDLYATQRRREAEEEVGRALADADAQARAVREAAEQMAKRIEAEGRQRQQALAEESRSVEVRLQRALAGFRHMTAQLEELLEGRPRGDGGSLVEALDLERRRQHTA